MIRHQSTIPLAHRLASFNIPCTVAALDHDGKVIPQTVHEVQPDLAGHVATFCYRFTVNHRQRSQDDLKYKPQRRAVAKQVKRALQSLRLHEGTPMCKGYLSYVTSPDNAVGFVISTEARARLRTSTHGPKGKPRTEVRHVQYGMAGHGMGVQELSPFAINTALKDAAYDVISHELFVDGSQKDKFEGRLTWRVTIGEPDYFQRIGVTRTPIASPIAVRGPEHRSQPIDLD